MLPRKGFLLLAVAALGLAATACSLIIGNFNECDDSRPCSKPGLICTNNLCVGEEVPKGCAGYLDAGIPGTYGSLDGGIGIGVVTVLTNPDGTRNERSIQNWNAIQLAVSEINGKGELGNRKLALVTCDFQGDKTQVAAQVEWMATVRKVPAAIVYRSDPIFEVRQVAVDRNVLIMSPSATAKDISLLADIPAAGGTVGLIWRTAPSDELQGRVIADILRGNAIGADAGFGSAATKVGILYSDNNYGAGLNETVSTKVAAAPGGRTVKSIPFKVGDDSSINSAITGASGLNAFDPDVTLLIAQVDEAIKVINAAAGTTNLTRAAGHQWFFTDSSKSPALGTGLGAKVFEVERALGTAPAQDSGSGYAQFKSRFMPTFGTDPLSYSFTSHSYDAMYLIALGAVYGAGPSGNGELDGEKIALGLTKLSSPGGKAIDFKPADFTGAAAELKANRAINVSGASGELDFDPLTGEAPSGFEVWQVRGGTPQPVTNVNPP